MRHFLILLIGLLPLSAWSQSVLEIDGEVAGYGIRQQGEMPQALNSMLQGVRARSAGNARWVPSRLFSSPSRSVAATHSAERPATIGPLLRTVRAQSAPYNLLCPTWTADDGTVSSERCLTGCVATSIEQVLTYYQFPEVLKDTLFGWETSHYHIDDMLPGTRFDWQHVRNDYRYGYTEAEADAISLLSLACGMAVHMNYGLEASGANFWWGLDALRRAMGFETVHWVDRLLYPPQRWNALLRSELELGHPLAYAGHNMELGGHAFNIDGVDADGFYHVNWGYGGAYDGWYDLDLLNPWEPTDTDSLGIAEGFFCNQSVLILHPTAYEQPLFADTLCADSLGVVCDSVSFLRQPDLQGFVPVDFHFRNTSSDTVTYTYEVMTWLPTDTAIFYQADYVGLAAVTIPAGQTRTQRTYCRFMKAGDRLFGLSHDDVTLPFVRPVSIANGVSPRLEWGNVSSRIEGSTATFTIPVTNQASGGIAGNLVTLCLYPDGKEGEDTRHWTVLSLPGGSSQTIEVTFTGLDAATHYTFLVRCPWQIVASTDFTTGIVSLSGQPEPLAPFFDLSGRRVVSPAMTPRPQRAGPSGIVVSAGHKYLVR